MGPPSGSIEYDGRVYDSWDDLPEEARQLIRSAMPDTDDDGVPDVFQGGPAPEASVTRTVTVDGTTYDSPDDLPPHLRAHLERAAADLAPGQTTTERFEGEPTPVVPGQHQILLNGQPVEQPHRPWWRRLLGRD